MLVNTHPQPSTQQSAILARGCTSPPPFLFPGSIRTFCHVQQAQCPSQPCLNGGVCTEGWNRFVCDCTDTIYTGPTCGKEAATLAFNGTQHMEVTMEAEQVTTDSFGVVFDGRRIVGVASKKQNNVGDTLTKKDCNILRLQQRNFKRR